MRIFLYAMLLILLSFYQRSFATSCVFNSSTAVAFGVYDVFSFGDDDSVGDITYECRGVGRHDLVTIYLGYGNASSSFKRYMLSGNARLQYNLYLDPARTQIWGDGTSGSVVYGPVNPQNSADVTVPIYGRVPDNQDASVGVYADSIIATVNF